MQLAISEWEDIIRINGVCLEPNKTKWYLVGYEWIQGKWKCTSPGQDKILEGANKTREIVSLRYLKSNKAMFMLGMDLALDGIHHFITTGHKLVPYVQGYTLHKRYK